MARLKKALKKLRMRGWVTDPRTKEKSVSLTLMIVSYILLIFVSGLELMGLVVTLSVFPELFWTTMALYFGRKLSPKGRIDFSGEPAPDDKPNSDKVK